jgi:hypothetical protein
LFQQSGHWPLATSLAICPRLLARFGKALRLAIIPEHLEPSPARVRPAHEPYWTGVGRDLEAREIFFSPGPARNAVLVVLHYKMRGRPAQARAWPEPDRKIEARCI